MGERELIEHIRKLAGAEAPAWLALGIGDDAAVVELPGGERVVLTTDMLIEGVHFDPGTPPRLVGRKAIARALSDIAAMAARPLCTLASASFGKLHDESTCREVSEALWQAASEFSAPLIGGDMASSDGPLSIAVTAVGTPGPRGVVGRGGAQPGDAVCVTGRLGGSRRGRHLTFQPRIREALDLVEAADVHAMIDISDGLSTDALHIAEASGAGMALCAEDVPLSQDAVAMAEQTGREPIWHALNDGEDYELLFCLPPNHALRLAEEGLGEVEVTVIGHVISGPRSILRMPDGRQEPLVSHGWEHMT